MAVDGDHAPDDEVPALPQMLQRHVELVGVRRRAARRPAVCGVRVGVGDRDDREARLDRLRVDERDLRRRRVDDDARRRRRPEQRSVRERRRRQRQRCGGDRAEDDGASHRTCNVNGAVSTWPSTRHWRNRRHVPATGTRTPTVSLPGVEEVPVTFAPPSEARAVGRSGRADVRVEVVERPVPEEDRVRERSEPRRELRRRAVRARHREREEARPGSHAAAARRAA